MPDETRTFKATLGGSLKMANKIMVEARETAKSGGWAYVIGLLESRFGLSPRDLTLCGWPFKLVVEADFVDVPRETVNEDEEVDPDVGSLLTCLALREVFRATKLREKSTIVGSDGVINEEKVVAEAMLLESVDSWSEWLALTFPHVDPEYVQFMAEQGAK